MRSMLAFPLARFVTFARLIALAVFALVIAIALLGRAHAQSIKVPVQEKPPAKTPDTCATVSASVQSEAYGYKHIVTLANHCDKAVQCEVWTDVDPTPRNTLVAKPGESVDIVTRIGSPASQVTAQKLCRFK